MKVKAAPGVRVPIEGAPRKYIIENVEADVSESAYYLRRISDGDLIRTDTQPTTVATSSTTITPVRGVTS